MEWIKTILEKHKNEDGTYNIGEALKEINQEFPKNAVPKDQYNNVANQLKDTNKMLKDLQEKTKDNPDIQKQLQDAETAREQAESDLQKLQTDVQLKEALGKAGAKDVDYMIFKLGEIELNKDGSIKDLDNKVKTLQESNPDHFESKEDKKDDKHSGGYQVKDTKLDKGAPAKTYSQDQLEKMTPQEINDNWEAVSASLSQGGNE
ncbi:phage scaffolding protein [Amphibacillus sp. Q70]|uniref:phage scaffolding protein n=1 Tax=Amphibacillus sp. Q70 TaxID=3453416 RepID=UPI003F8490F8